MPQISTDTVLNILAWVVIIAGAGFIGAAGKGIATNMFNKQSNKPNGSIASLEVKIENLHEDILELKSEYVRKEVCELHQESQDRGFKQLNGKIDRLMKKNGV